MSETEDRPNEARSAGENGVRLPNATARPVFMPETFTGVGREWSDWSEQFDLAAEVNGWDDGFKLKFMSLLLSGRARDMYSGLSGEAKQNYGLLKAAMARCFEPCDSTDWSRVEFTGRRRMHNETAREFGNALRRLAFKAYPSADNSTRDMLARDQFLTHFATGDFRITLRRAKPNTLEEAIDLAAEIELLKNLEQNHLIGDAKVRGVVVEHEPKSDEQMTVMLGMVEELRQEVKSLRITVNDMQRSIRNVNASAGQFSREPGFGPRNGASAPEPARRDSRAANACWECGCTRHIKRDCPYLQGNYRGQVQYLGHIISSDGVKADPAKVEAIRQWPVPKTQTEVRSFVGLASYYRRFVRGFAEIARPLHQLTEKGRRFKWTEVCQAAFEQLKLSLMSAPILGYPDPSKTFILDTDASDAGIGAVLSQEGLEGEYVIAYASRALSKQERKYATTKKELLSMVTFIKHFKHYLLGKEFILRTDHASLRWLHNFQGLEGQLARWVEQLASFQYKIVHRPGKGHANADALSRLPAYVAASHDSEPALSTPGASVIAAVQNVPPKVTSGGEGDEFTLAQQMDHELQAIISLKTGGDVGLQPPPELQKYAPVWPQLQMQGSRLVRVPPPNSDAANQVQVVVPTAMVSNILKQLHNDVTGGHLGVQKLQAKVKDRFFWLGWFGDVKQWCRECVDCGSQTTNHRDVQTPVATPGGVLPEGTLPQTPVATPGDVLPEGTLPQTPVATPGGVLPEGILPQTPVATPGGVLPEGTLPQTPVATPGGVLPEGTLPQIPAATPGIPSDGTQPEASVAMTRGPEGSQPQTCAATWGAMDSRAEVTQGQALEPGGVGGGGPPTTSWLEASGVLGHCGATPKSRRRDWPTSAGRGQTKTLGHSARAGGTQQGVTPPQDSYPGRQRRPPVWSRDYEM
ncbi:hypothetical protein ACEWY4_018368 [Coilia grayii]|uniref:Gypsy retrotransposon integrase-like protein 1 n=1 Tax=Coilia grayii TaxID=363190 RepID=A0ABD1JKJ9_9TELE